MGYPSRRHLCSPCLLKWSELAKKAHAVVLESCSQRPEQPWMGRVKESRYLCLPLLTLTGEISGGATAVPNRSIPSNIRAKARIVQLMIC